MSEQILVYGATVERSTDGVSYTQIPEMKSVAVPAVETEYVEATSLDSPDGFREYVPGLKDAGTLALSAGYTAAGYEQQVADQATGNAIYYRTTLAPQPAQTTGDVFVFQGFPTPSLTGDDVAGLVDMTINLRTTGNVTWTRGT